MNAFSGLIRSWEDELYRIAWSIVQNDADAGDALQNAIIYCWEKIREVRAPAHLKTWATRVLLSKCYDIVRTRKRVVPMDELPAEAVTEEDYAQAEWKMSLALLDERSRLLIVLHYVDGYKVAEIARILDANENTVKTWLRRSLMEIRECLGL